MGGADWIYLWHFHLKAAGNLPQRGELLSVIGIGSTENRVVVILLVVQTLRETEAPQRSLRHTPSPRRYKIDPSPREVALLIFPSSSSLTLVGLPPVHQPLLCRYRQGLVSTARVFGGFCAPFPSPLRVSASLPQRTAPFVSLESVHPGQAIVTIPMTLRAAYCDVVLSSRDSVGSLEAGSRSPSLQLLLPATT